MTAGSRVVFALVNARQRPDTVAQLVDALAPHAVYLHQDFRQQPAFGLVRDNLRYVPDPVPTGWATWGFTTAVLKLLACALRSPGCEYIQLLSPTCLPVRPIGEYVDAMLNQSADANADILRLDSDDDVLMSYGWRAFAPAGSWRSRVLNQLRRGWHGRAPQAVQRGGLMVFSRGEQGGVPVAVARRTVRAITRAAARGWFGPHPYLPAHGHPPVAGSTWFGARRHVVASMVDLAGRTGRLALARHLMMSDEHLLPSLLIETGARLAPSNHFVSRFDATGHPAWLTEDDLPRIQASGRWFARKFPDDPGARVRLRVLADRRAECRDALRTDGDLARPPQA